MLRLASRSLAALAVTAGIACTNATGTVEGGELLLADPCAGSGAATWTYLYTCYFGPAGKASCTSLSSCHGSAAEAGSLDSGFVCGGNKESCWMSMTQPTEADIFEPVVCLSPTCSQGVTNPTQTTLWTALHQAGPPIGLDNMPCGDSPACPSSAATYTFTTDDLALISSWIQQGAQDN